MSSASLPAATTHTTPAFTAFLIATAMKYRLTVITEENKKGEKKIPFVCRNLQIPCVDILGLCELEGWGF